MITLDMAQKSVPVVIPTSAFSTETGILTLQISLGAYLLTSKTVTAVFSKTGVETGVLTVTDSVIQLPIVAGYVLRGVNEIQLKIREGLTLELSPIMTWRILQPVNSADPSDSDVDVITWLLNAAVDATNNADEALETANETIEYAEAQLETTGDTQTARVTSEGDTQELRVTGEGNTQVLRVTGEGTTQVGLVQAAGASLQETIEDAGETNTTLKNTTIPAAQSINTTLSVTTTPAAQSINDTLTNTTTPAANAINSTLVNTTIPAATAAEESLQTLVDNSQIGSLDDLKTTAKLTLVDAINENSLAFSRIAAPKYGVSGVGGSAPALTKLWDLVGKSVAVGTDIAGATNDLDALAPFNRRKCVGTWVSGANEAIFVPQAYYGDPDYAEDGSKGDYVAVDIEPFWWYESSDGSTIGVSPGPQYGWEIHPICVNKRTGIVRDHTYIPAFALALKDGKAVSLPGYRNERGNYKTLWDAAKTYDGTAKQYAILEPSEIDHYEWLLQTIEFATTNPQTVMCGAVYMRYADDPITALTPTTGVVSATAGAAFVIGQNVYIGAAYNSDTQASHKIDNIEACDETGNTAGTGYYLLTMTPYAGATDITTITTPKIAIRPWSTGACDGVLSPSGSPVSNSSGKYPARYRWRENPYGNQNSTCVDLMNRLIGGNLEWYYLSDPLAYYPADVNKPDEAVLIAAGSAWTKLAVTPENYADGYIKKRGSDPALKHIKVPTLTSGASDNTYFSDYAYLVYSPLVRSVRRRGHTTNGSHAGPCSVSAHYAPGTSHWYFGGALFMVQ